MSAGFGAGVLHPLPHTWVILDHGNVLQK
jgi:hypothetical protein